MERVELCDLVEDTLRFTRYDRLFRHRIEVRRVYDAQPVVFVNRSKIKQVLLNLLRNAAQAMHGQHREPHFEVRVSSDGESGFLSVTDNGSGIPPDRLDKIWQPFYTTKGQEGTGLGLDLCRQICERHHGGISVTSEVGVGTTFTVRLPLREDVAAAAAA
jgi:signal transduction histidine kinase